MVINFPSVSVLGPVQALKLSATTSNSATLRWEAQVESLCSTDEYYVEYVLLNRDQCEDIANVTWHNNTVENTTVTISGLEPHSTYEMVVYPFNGAGLGAGVSITIETDESGKQFLFIVQETHFPNWSLKKESVIAELLKRFKEVMRLMPSN